MKTANLELSRQFVVSGARKRKRACWYNAVCNLLFLPDLSNGFYVEGFVVTPGSRVIEHGWVEINGQVIDTTPGYYERKYTAQLLKMAYFPAVYHNEEQASLLIGSHLPTVTIWTSTLYADTLSIAEKYNLSRIMRKREE